MSRWWWTWKHPAIRNRKNKQHVAVLGSMGEGMSVCVTLPYPHTCTQVIEPVSDIDLVLSRVHLVLAPSLWLEAWGMVVTEALLRGLPAVVSDAGEY